eukprot:TRINITY_DN33715_c0_g1_i1.p1 TRINITY_DN33715_c0_g1~~TRINITY_DN33715_c0_g1_i1.p1  ORF type:complete len:867 (-),score=137.86 TRINITY_DN33715_c0_g1_i1:30-2630(-)
MDSETGEDAAANFTRMIEDLEIASERANRELPPAVSSAPGKRRPAPGGGRRQFIELELIGQVEDLREYMLAAVASVKNAHSAASAAKPRAHSGGGETVALRSAAAFLVVFRGEVGAKLIARIEAVLQETRLPNTSNAREYFSACAEACVAVKQARDEIEDLVELAAVRDARSCAGNAAAESFDTILRQLRDAKERAEASGHDALHDEMEVQKQLEAGRALMAGVVKSGRAVGGSTASLLRQMFGGSRRGKVGELRALLVSLQRLGMSVEAHHQMTACLETCAAIETELEYLDVVLTPANDTTHADRVPAPSSPEQSPPKWSLSFSSQLRSQTGPSLIVKVLEAFEVGKPEYRVGDFAVGILGDVTSKATTGLRSVSDFLSNGYPSDKKTEVDSTRRDIAPNRAATYVELEVLGGGRACTSLGSASNVTNSVRGHVLFNDERHVLFLPESVAARKGRGAALLLRSRHNKGMRGFVRGDPLVGEGMLELGSEARDCLVRTASVELLRNSTVTGSLTIEYQLTGFRDPQNKDDSSSTCNSNTSSTHSVAESDSKIDSNSVASSSNVESSTRVPETSESPATAAAGFENPLLSKATVPKASEDVRRRNCKEGMSMRSQRERLARLRQRLEATRERLQNSGLDISDLGLLIEQSAPHDTTWAIKQAADLVAELTEDDEDDLCPLVSKAASDGSSRGYISSGAGPASSTVSDSPPGRPGMHERSERSVPELPLQLPQPSPVPKMDSSHVCSSVDGLSTYSTPDVSPMLSPMQRSPNPLERVNRGFACEEVAAALERLPRRRVCFGVTEVQTYSPETTPTRSSSCPRRRFGNGDKNIMVYSPGFERDRRRLKEAEVGGVAGVSKHFILPESAS